MSMGMEIGVFLAYAAGMMMVYVAGRFLLVPLKWLAGILINSVAGGILILLLNLVGGVLGIFIPLNAVTAVSAGVLGVPGIVAMAIFFS